MLAKFNFYYNTLDRSPALLASIARGPASQSSRESVLAITPPPNKNTLRRLIVPFAEQLLRLQVTERTRTAFTSRMP